MAMTIMSTVANRRFAFAVDASCGREQLLQRRVDAVGKQSRKKQPNGPKSKARQMNMAIVHISTRSTQLLD
jgi:hypothetical protein